MGFDPVILALAKGYTNSQRLGYTESEKVVLYPENTVDCDEEFTQGAISPSYRGYGYELYQQKYESVPMVVIFDGVPYECNTVIENATHGFWRAGNYALYSASGEDTGEPFCIRCNRGGWVYATTSGEHTVYIEIPERVKTIDPKFIPGAVLPVVELSEETTSTLVASDSATANEEETALFTAAKEKQTAILIKCSYESLHFASVANLCPNDVSGTIVYKSDWGLATFRAFFEDGSVRITLSQ